MTHRELRLKATADALLETIDRLNITIDWGVDNKKYFDNILAFVENYDMRTALNEKNRLLRKLLDES